MKLIEVTAIYVRCGGTEKPYKRRTMLNLDRFIKAHEDFSFPKERTYIFYDSGEGEGGFVIDETLDSFTARLKAVLGDV